MRKRLSTLCMAIILGGMFLSSCTRHYTISVMANNDKWGTVAGGGRFKEGESTTISAKANDGYRFVKWDDGYRDNPRTIIVTSNATYTAIFEEPVIKPSAKVTFKGSEWEAAAIEGDYYNQGNQTKWKVAAAPISTHEFPKVECSAYVTAVGHYSDATTNGYDYQNNIFACIEFYESNVLFGDDDIIHGDWWAKSAVLNITTFDPTNLKISGEINATMFNSIEAFVEGVGIDNSTTTEMKMEMSNITLNKSTAKKKKSTKR